MIGIGYSAGGGGRLFSRAPKSPAAAAPWRRRRCQKNMAPRISATPRRPPITPPAITAPLPPLLPPLLLGDKAAGGKFAPGTTTVVGLGAWLTLDVVGWSAVDGGVFRDEATQVGLSGKHDSVGHKPGNLQGMIWALAKGIDDV